MPREMLVFENGEVIFYLVVQSDRIVNFCCAKAHVWWGIESMLAAC